MKKNIINVLSTSLLTLAQIQVFAGNLPTPTEAPPQLKEAGLSPNLDLSTAPSNDPYFGYQWALQNNGQSYVPTIGDLVFEDTILSNPEVQIGWKNFDAQMKRDVIIAVMDSGMYTTNGGHPELKDALLPGKNFVDPNSKVYDDKLGHGTHIAGIIAAKINNNVGISGLTNRVKILPLKVFGEKDAQKDDKSENTVEEESSASNEITPRLIKAIDFAIEQKVDIIQLSLGWPRKEDSSAVRAAFDKAIKAGIIIVAASGNDGHTAQIFPCAYKDVICVGSISLDGSTSSFSNRGGHVDLMATGQAILSTIPPTLPSLKFGTKGYETKNGTSQAAPFVSGAAAILRGIYPNETADQIKNRLRLGATKTSEDSIFGLLNIAKSVSLTSLEIAFANTKSVEDAVVEKNSLSFEFPVTVFSNLSSAPKVEVKSLNPDVKIESITKQATANFESVYIVKAKAASLQTNNIFNYEVLVNSRKQTAQLTLKLKLEDMKSTTLMVENIEPVKKSGLLPVSAAQNTAKIEFWSFIADKETKSMKLHVWEKVNDKLIEKSTLIESAEAPLASFNLLSDDFDFDGSLDYLMLSTRNAGTKEAAIDYVYLDKNLKVMHRFTVDTISPLPLFVGPKDIAIAKIRFATKSGFIKTPIFKGTSVAPRIDTMGRYDTQKEATAALKNPVSSEDYITARGLPMTEINPAVERYFYFEPKAHSNGRISMQQRALTGHIAEASILRLIYEQQVKNLLAQPKFSGLVSSTEITSALDSDQLFKLIADKGLNKIISSTEKSALLTSNIHQDLTVIGLLPQSNSDIAVGRFSMLISLGRGVEQDYYRIEFNDLTDRYNHVKIIALNLPQIDLKRNTLKDAISIKQGIVDTESALTAIYSFSSARAALLRGDRIGGIKIDLADRKEAVATVLRSFTKGSDFVNFVETTKNMRIKGIWNGKPVDESAQVFRTSFLPGYSFSELFEAVLVSEKQNPGVVIDSSDIFSNRVAIYSLEDDGKMRSSIERSIEIPKNCRARKKPSLNKQGFSSIAVICADKIETAGTDPQFKVRVEIIDLK